MKKMLTALMMLLIATSGAYGQTGLGSGVVVPAVDSPWPGKIVVTADEWLLSDPAVAIVSSTPQFALNVAQRFTGGRPGRFLVYSTDFGLTGAQLATSMTAAGHSWTVTTNIDVNLPTLLQYDAVFLAGDAVDNDVLINYVRAGGNVFIAGGTRWRGITESDRWNRFLNAFGLNFLPQERQDLPGWPSVAPVPPAWDSRLFAGVEAVVTHWGNPVTKLNPHDSNTELFELGYAMFATYEARAIPVFVDLCLNTFPLLFTNGQFSVVVTGPGGFDVAQIDPASVRILGVVARDGDSSHAVTTSIRPRLEKTPYGRCGSSKAAQQPGLVAKFDARDLRFALRGLLGRTVDSEDTLVLAVTGRLKAAHGGALIRGEDVVVTPRSWSNLRRR